jgi:hypothetical protein
MAFIAGCWFFHVGADRAMGYGPRPPKWDGPAHLPAGLPAEQAHSAGSRSRGTPAVYDDRYLPCSLDSAPFPSLPFADDEVFGVYEEVTGHLSVRLVVYDNPATTGFTSTDELHGRIAPLPHVASIKIPAVTEDIARARERVERLRAVIPEEVTMGVSDAPSHVRDPGPDGERFHPEGAVVR